MPTAPQAVAKKQDIPVRRISPSKYTFRLIKTYPVPQEGGIGEAFLPRNTDYATNWTPTNQDDIYWPYRNGVPLKFEDDFDPKDQDIEFYLRTIRYISGATSIFKDEQESNNDVYKLDMNGRNRLLENPANKERLNFSKGERNVEATDRTIWQFLWCMNQCKNQNPKANNKGARAKAINAEFELLDFAYAGEQKVLLGMQKEKAFDIARTAREEEMIPHAKYLNISFTHMGSTDKKSMDEIRSDYKDYALAKPDVFLRTFTDPKIKTVYQINNLLEQQEITLLKTPGQAHWVSTGNFIAQIPPDSNPIEFLAEFSMTKDGEEFANNLRSFK